MDATNIARQLKLFQQAGLGGVQVTPVYGAKGWESQYLPYLSPEWMQMMDYTAVEARRLGLGMDMTLGTGWCFGGPNVSKQDANASVVVKTLNVSGGGKLEEKFNRSSTQALMAFSPDGHSVDLAPKISANGEVNWTVPAGTWTVYAVSQKPSGQKVKRAAPGGDGWMLNPLYPRAMRDWLRWFDQAFTDYPGSRPEAVFQDSYEYQTDWSPDFFAQFEKYRGYKLQSELPALFGNAQDDHTARVKYDYRRTLSDIMVGQSEPAWIDWAHQNGFAAIYQAHGTPGNWLDLYAVADIPETEMFHNDRNILISKFASSAAHVPGRQLVRRGNRHLAEGTFHRDARRPEVARRRHVSLRREPRLLPRRLLFARRCALARLAVLCRHRDEPAQFHLARRPGPQRIHRPLPVRPAIRQTRQRHPALLAGRRLLERPERPLAADDRQRDDVV